MAAFQLGGAHPPGHPGHSLFAKLLCFLPVGEIATRVSIGSSLSAGATLAATVALVNVFFPKQGWLGLWTAAFVAITPAVLLNATRPEVYLPVYALLSWALVFALRFLRSDSSPQARDALVSIMCIALAATIHPAIALAMAVPVSVAFALRAKRRALRLAPWALALCLLLSLTYLYLPLRAHAQSPPPFVWGDPSSLGNFIDLITARLYQGNFAQQSLLQRMASQLSLLAEGPGLPLLFVGFAGLLFGWITRLRGSGLLLSVAITTTVAAGLQSAFNPDMRAYLGMVSFCLAVGCAIFAKALASAVLPVPKKNQQPSVIQSLASSFTILPILLIALLAPPSDAMERERSDDAMQLWEESLALMPPGPGLFFASGDPLLFVCIYEHFVSGARPDIAVANPTLVRDRWFLQHLKASHPELYYPYLDDGRKGQIAERLYWENSQRGFPVAGDALRPRPLAASPLGRGFAFHPSADHTIALPPNPPLVFQGYVGRKLANLSALRRARYDLSLGRISDAIVSLGVGNQFPEILVGQRATAPSLLPYIPDLSKRFLYEDFEKELVKSDISWQLGLQVETKQGSIELKIHDAWRLLLQGDFPAAKRQLSALGAPALAATPPMLIALGKSDLAERFLRQVITDNASDDSALALLASLLANRKDANSLRESTTLFEKAAALSPNNSETWNRLGLVYIQQGRIEDARAAWQKALQLQPNRSDTRAFLKKLTRESKGSSKSTR